MKHVKKLIGLVLLVLCLTSCSVAQPAPGSVTQPAPVTQTEQTTLSSADLHLHFIDVGQGDSTFIELPGGRTMLIDAGEKDQGATVKEYIKSLGYTRLDYVIGSHPHSDHIGGLAEVIEAFAVGEIWMPHKSSTTTTFVTLLGAIKNKGLTVNTAKAGKQILQEENLQIDILSPTKEDYGDEMNLYSAVIKITYESQRFLIMGDAEEENEAEMSDVEADLIRVGHHGSKTSSSHNFVQKVGAKYAVISVGKGNSYGLPKYEIITRWQTAGAAVYRTDEAGNIIASSDGKNITIESKPTAQKEQTQQESRGTWVLNISSKKIHRPDCTSVAKMKESNRQESDSSIEQLLQEGYTPCGNCDPLEN